VRVTPLTTRYRVTEKRLYSSADDYDPDVIKYAYDEAATNDPAHSKYVQDALDEHGDTGGDTYEDYLYAAPYGEFRGHALSTRWDESGLKTTTFYHQDDARKGRAHTTIVGIHDYYQDFETSLSDGGEWSANGGTTSLDYINGDYASKTVSQNTVNGNYAIKREYLTVDDGEAVIVQFRLGNSGSATLKLDNASWSSGYRAWGLVVAGQNAYAEYCIEQNCQNGGTLTGNFKRNTWYTLVLIVEDDVSGTGDKYAVFLWERDNPDDLMHAERNMDDGLDLRFVAIANNYATLWLDEYSEGRIQSISQTRFAADADMAVPDPLPERDDGSAYEDLDIVWVYTDWSRQQVFNGDSIWVGTKTHYEYIEADQGNVQLGNQTHVVESEWNGSAFEDVRIRKTSFYTNTNTSVYLVGLPGFEALYECPSGTDGSCYESLFGASPAYTAFDYIQSAMRYVYDRSDEAFWQPPTTGKLMAQRLLVEVTTPGNSSTQKFQDTLYPVNIPSEEIPHI
jgi:hypothetical protein